MLNPSICFLIHTLFPLNRFKNKIFDLGEGLELLWFNLVCVKRSCLPSSYITVDVSLLLDNIICFEGPKRRTREGGGGSEWEPIKILLEGDRGSNKMNTTSNTRLRLNYPNWSRPCSHWSATDPRNQQTTFQAKIGQDHAAETCTTCCLCHTGQTDGLRRSDR
jgi:hypothetical protein